MYVAWICFGCFWQLAVLQFFKAEQAGRRGRRGIDGRKAAALNLTINKNIPRNAPWGDYPGRGFEEEEAPLKDKTIDL